jgi:cell volume regulation protein A
MQFTSENVLLVGSILLIAGIMVQKTGYRFGVPALLLFLLVGMGFGCDGLGLQFDSVTTAQFIGMVALCVILFSGGMDTRLSDIRPVLAPGLVLSTLGVFLTALFTGLFVWLVSGFSWTNIHFALVPSLLLAATMSSTDSASVFAILRTQKMSLKNNLRPMLELESGSNDPMAYLLTVVLISVAQSATTSVGSVLLMLCVQFVVGAAVGFAMGKLAVWTTQHLNIDNPSLYPILLLAAAFLTFSTAGVLQGNGYLAVYICGIVVGNQKLTYRREVATFMDGLTWLFQIIMFLVLGLLVYPSRMMQVSLVALLIGLFMILVGRPLAVWLCLLPFRKITTASRYFVSWVGLRGAVPIIFATYPVVAGIEGSEQLFNIVFFITILSLLVQGTTIPWVARLLRLSEPLPATGNTFGVELPEETDTHLSDLFVTAEMLQQGDTLKEVSIPAGALVMMVKRGEAFLIPNGSLHLREGDKLLLISENQSN